MSDIVPAHPDRALSCFSVSFRCAGDIRSIWATLPAERGTGALTYQDANSAMIYDQLDRLRRVQGRWLDIAGLAPRETPSRIVLEKPPVTLKTYAASDGPALLIIPAPIKRAYLWDLAPSISVVQQCLRHGIRPYVVQWERPTPADQRLGLSAYADALIEICREQITAETGAQQVFVAGHSLGGVLAAIYTALHPERVRGLILLSAPLQFGPGTGVFAPLVAYAPHAQVLTAGMPTDVAGTFLNTVSVLAAPAIFEGERWSDWWRSLADPQALFTHLRVMRWTFDEQALPRQLFVEVVEWLYRENRFMQGTLSVGGRLALPSAITAPIISVIERHSALIPPEAVLPFLAATGSRDTQTLWYEGDVGVVLQHLGMLVGRRAHQELWPTLCAWIRARASEQLADFNSR